MTVDLHLRWKAPGPVAAAFMASDKPVEAICGPIGSGKTSACLLKMIRRARQQQPSTKDGVRKFKFCCVRDTYRQLWRTTIPSWWRWVPKDAGEWTGGEDQPATHRVLFELGSGEKIELIAEFVAIGEHKVEDVLRGYEPTAFYLNEADLLAQEVLTYARGRAGRYPPMDEGGPTWWGVVMDLNAPDVDSWAYEQLWGDLPEGFAFFRQPSALSAEAENIENLPRGYYETQMTGQPSWYVRKMIKSIPSYSRDGDPVYADEFDDRLHVASQPLKPIAGRPLIIGLDAGGHPAAVIFQRTLSGQWRGLDELVPDSDGFMGPNRFGEQLNQLLREKYEFLDGVGWVDPSALYGVDKEDEDDKNWVQIVATKTKLRIRPAPTNSLTPRIEAVRVPLTRLIDGAQPGLLLSPTMRVLIKGFASGYRYRRIKVAGGTRRDDKPEKNRFSHPHDGVQYALLGGGEYAEVMGREQKAASGRRQTRAVDDDHPQGEWAGGQGADRRFDRERRPHRQSYAD